MTSLALIWDLITRDNASAGFLKVGAAAEKTAISTEAASRKTAAASDKMAASNAKLGKSSEVAGKKLTNLATGLGALAVVDAGVHMVKMAGDFQQSTNVLVTAAGESSKNLDMVRKGILNIATDTGTAWQQVTDGMYTLEKAGYRGAAALQVERAAAQGAREEGASLGTVTQAMTSIMASYGLKASDAVMVMNELKTAAGESKTSMENFAGSLSTVLPIASANKISFADVAGALATLTQHGTSADEATQELANTIRNLSAPNAVAIKEMQQLGISSVDITTNLGKRGLVGTLEYLSNVVRSKTGPDGTLLLSTFNASKAAAKDAAIMFANLPASVQKVAKAYEGGTLSLHDWRAALKEMPAPLAALAVQWATTENNSKAFQQQLRLGLPLTQTSTDAIKKMTGGMNGLNTTLQVTSGLNYAATQKRIAAIAASAKDAGTNVQGWESTQKLFNVQFDKFKQSAEATGITLGTKLLPILGTVANWISQHTGLVTGMVVAFAGIATAIGAIKLAHEAWDAAMVVTQGAMKLFGIQSTAQIDALILKENELEAAALAANGAVAGGGAAGAAGGAGLASGLLPGGAALGTVLAPLITSGDRSNMQQWQTAMDEEVKTYPKIKALGLDAFGALSTAMQHHIITVDQFKDALSKGITLQQELKSSSDAAALRVAAEAGAFKLVGTAADAQGKPLDTLDKKLSQFDGRRFMVKINVDTSNAMFDLSQLQSQINGVMNTAKAVRLGSQTGGHLGTHAKGGYLDKGWNLVGEQGPELIGPNGQVIPAGTTAGMRGGKHAEITQNFYGNPGPDVSMLAQESSRRIALQLRG